MKLNKEQVEAVFASAKRQGEYITGLYKLAIPDFDEVLLVEEYPKCSTETWKEICELAMRWDAKFAPDCLAGGAWMNYGFDKDENLALWHVAPGQYKYHTYAIIHLADNEWGNDTMQKVAEEYFTANPSAEFVQVLEHGGWHLGYRRDLTIWTTANDGATCKGTRPKGYSGLTIRRVSEQPAEAVV